MAVYVPGVAEYSTTTGTGSFALEGAIPGFVTFAARVSHNKTVAYRATDGARLEIGRGVFDRTNNLLLRNVVIYPLTGKIDWSAGRRLIYLEIDDDAFDVSSLTGLAAIARTGSAADIVSGVLTVAHGGTGQSSYTNGQLLIGNGTGGTLEKGTLTAPAAGLTITGGGGSITFALANDLSALEAMSGTGLVARTASETYAQRTLTGTSDRISVSNGDGVSANPTVDIASSYVGQATITTLGTIGTGTWQGTAVGSAYGGTGQSTYTDGQLLIGNSSGGLTKTTLTAGSNITITNGDGSITIAATGGASSTLEDLQDVNIGTDLVTNDFVKFDGVEWVNSALVAGNGISISHGAATSTISLSAGATSQGTTTSPPTTTSTTGVMMGLAGSITPSRSGNIFLVIIGSMANNTANRGCFVVPRYGTGSAPANGDAPAGTEVGLGTFSTNAAANLTVPFSSSSIITGLGVGTTYWLDARYGALTSGTATFTNVTITAYEL